MGAIKRTFKKNTHNAFFKALAGFGRSMNRLYENRNHDIFSNGELTVIKKLARTGPSIVFDGGANIGNYSRLLSHYLPDAQIYAFEPVEPTYKQLLENLKDKTNVMPQNVGLYSSNETRSINIFNSHTHASIFDIEATSNSPVGKDTIELVQGDEFLQENRIKSIDFLKLDLEGAEYDAIKGFENSFREKIIKMVQFEYGYINISTKKLLIDFYNFFEDHGYLLGKVFPKIVEFREYKAKYEDFLGPNFIAIDKNEKELIELMKKK
ncbi:MAG: FkbM family methyltransferase [Marinilabiliaceae bacterium]